MEIRSLQACGFMYWFHNQTQDKYFVYFYKTTDSTGELIDSTDEGRAFWANLSDLRGMKLAPNFKEYLPMFLEGKYSEVYCAWDGDHQPDPAADNPWGIVYR